MEVGWRCGGGLVGGLVETSAIACFPMQVSDRVSVGWWLRPPGHGGDHTLGRGGVRALLLALVKRRTGRKHGGGRWRGSEQR